MATPYAIRTDGPRKLVSISFTQEIWDVAIADRFRADVLAAIASLRCAPGRHLTLVDLRNAVLQSKDVYERMQSLATASTAKRIALVAATPLARMQTKRLQLRDNIVMFADLPEAEAWLFGAEERTAA